MSVIKVNQALHDITKGLTNDQTGKLFYMLICYANGEDVKSDDVMVDIAFAALKQNVQKVNASRVKGKHIFKNSPYYTRDVFILEFKRTACYKRHPNIDILKIYEEIVNASDANHSLKYNNWISTAQNWVNRNPKRYQLSINSIIDNDPASAFMTKAQRQKAEVDLKLHIQNNIIGSDDKYSIN